ncbi:carbohydrate esterase family 3 protein [Apodospora peruviana]|uniref:Carbohydrate esterase family 3 protein n=1 Tax=Apodospora peruviana TaxID=516989 RepID=A0AAE0M221_9PEZI|nr:carbohydrate esterase family 3 protein [Apodospora peruviana]
MRCRALPGFGAIVLAASLLLSAQPVLGHSDGPNPNGDGFASDVDSSDTTVTLESDFPLVFHPHLEDVVDPGVGDNGVSDSTGLVVSNLTRRADRLGRRAAKDFYLRVMPLGASITQGSASSDGNGYRKWLRAQLRFKGWNVNMVGSKQDGSMADKASTTFDYRTDNEGHPGWLIDEIHSAFQATRYMFPNLVLINAGTNDCNQNKDIANAGKRIQRMVDDILSSIEGVTVIISTLARSKDHDDCASTVSQQIRDLVKNSYGNQRVGVADFYAKMTKEMLVSDGIHPNDEGYKLFAAVWWEAIHKLEDRIQPPNAASGIDDSAVTSGGTCEKVAGNARGAIKSQVGSGHDDGYYSHKSVAKGALLTARIEKRDDPASVTKGIPERMFFANIVVNNPGAPRSEALDDWIRVFHDPDTGKNTYYYRQNQGGGVFGPSTTFDVDMNCDSGPRYAFHDFNNDGLADFFCLQLGSAVSVSLNRGGNPPRFESIGMVVPTHSGYTERDVRIADIDGDGRADYCLINADGYLLCSRNGGQGDKHSWQGFSDQTGLTGMTFNKRKRGLDELIIADLNGDFRDDLMFIGDNGNAHTFVNMRGWGSGIVPDWRDTGITHPGQGQYGIRHLIKFGRIYGSGRKDYIYLNETKTHYDVVVWENVGGGSTKRKADGNFYCDMRGSGADDYVWIYDDGHTDSTDFYANIHQPPNWGHSITISLNVPGPRTGIHLADWNGDGKCDVLVQDKATGTLTLYENRYNLGDKTITFHNQGVVSNQARCTQGWGVGIFDRGMRMADLDGDGRADIICLEPNGRATAWLNKASGLVDVGQIKRTEGWDRANIRFADVEGSGKADLIHLNKYTGAATVLKNKGFTTNPDRIAANGGSSLYWTNRGVLYSPINRGECMHFTNQGGLGRADLLEVLPYTNQAWTYFNECVRLLSPLPPPPYQPLTEHNPFT